MRGFYRGYDYYFLGPPPAISHQGSENFQLRTLCMGGIFWEKKLYQIELGYGLHISLSKSIFELEKRKLSPKVFLN